MFDYHDLISKSKLCQLLCCARQQQELGKGKVFFGLVTYLRTLFHFYRQICNNLRYY